MAAEFTQAIDTLRAFAEPTRFRLLAILSHGELTVGEIAEIVGQSQPRISRHLKLLSDAGVLERFKEEQRTYYRLVNGDMGALTSQLLKQVEAGDPQLDRDRRASTHVLDKRVRQASAKWEDVRRSAESTYADEQVVQSMLKEVGNETWDQLLDVGTGTGNMLRLLGARARHAVGLDISPQALRIARAKVRGAGLSHCVFKCGDMYDLPFAAGSFDAVTLDHVLSAAERPAAALREAARALRKGGRMVVVEHAERLATTAEDEPQSVLRSWFGRAGLQCEKIKTIRSEQAQLILAIGRRS